MQKKINLDSLSTSVFGQFFRHIQTNVNKISNEACYIPKSKLPKKKPPTPPMSDEEIKRDVSIDDYDESTM